MVVPFSREILTKTEDSVVQQENDDKNSALHFAFLNDNSELAAFVINKHPGFVTEPRQSDGWLPLHFIARKGTAGCKNSLLLLLEAFPDAAKMKDVDGMVPLALACKNGSISMESLQLLFLHYPDAIDEVNDAGDPLVDHATSRKLLRRMATQLSPPPPAKKPRRCREDAKGQK
jgi:ankyrin repeat protein